MPERNEVSLHEVSVYLALAGQPGRWLTHAEIGALAPTVAPRTIRAHTQRLVTLGILDVAEVFPAHRYRIAATADKRNRGYLLRLTTAAQVFGLHDADVAP